jgi:anthranilate phosphoribosyltransferase
LPLIRYLHQVTAREHLSFEQAREAMTVLLEGRAAESQIGAFLVALKMKGETADELAGFARAMRDHMIEVEAGQGLVDTSGTGGDDSGTFNISTVAAIVMAGAGAKVAKHGNRSLATQSGSADVLEALGIRIALTPEEAGTAIREIGLGFLFAPNLHPAMRHAQPVRQAIKMRTAFNLIGPLANPARAQSQLIGAASLETAWLMAEALHRLGTHRSFVVHGHDGLDEISTTGPTAVFEVSAQGVQRHTWTAHTFGLNSASKLELKGGDAAQNAQIAREILAGEKGPKREIVLANAAAGLLAAGLAASLEEGVLQAAKAIDDGSAEAVLSRLTKAFPAR